MSQVDYFLKLERFRFSSDLRGTSKDRDHLGWIELLGFQWDAGPGGPAGPGNPTFRELSCWKLADGTSAQLQIASARGESFERAILHIRRGVECWLELSSLLIASVRAESSAMPWPDSRIDSLTLSFDGFAMHVGRPILPKPGVLANGPTAAGAAQLRRWTHGRPQQFR